MLSNNPYKLDAGESAFFRRQLEYVKSQTYETKYKQLKAFDLIPISTEAPAGADSITYRKFSGIGVAKIIADYAHDFPRVDTFGEEETVKVRSLGDSYGYSIKEIRRAAMAGTPLDTRRSDTARRAIEELINTLAWDGDSNYSINGLIDYSGITSYTIPNGAGGNSEWSTKTPDEIVADMTGIVNAVISSTNGREVPDIMTMPITQYNLIANTRMTGGSDTTIMKFFMDNNPYINQIDWVTELDGAGAAGADRLLVYTNDPRNLTLEIPQPFEQFEEQWQGMEAVVPCHAETAGIIVYYPLSVAYGDGI